MTAEEALCGGDNLDEEGFSQQTFNHEGYEVALSINCQPFFAAWLVFLAICLVVLIIIIVCVCCCVCYCCRKKKEVP